MAGADSDPACIEGCDLEATLRQPGAEPQRRPAGNINLFASANDPNFKVLLARRALE
jgi:hypothetical protein